jgi:hypothetical protein
VRQRLDQNLDLYSCFIDGWAASAVNDRPLTIKALEFCVFLGRALKAPKVRRIDRASKSKVAQAIPIRHRDEVEAPVTDCLQEAYELSDGPAPKADPNRATSKPKPKSVAARKPEAPVVGLRAE